MLTACIRGSTAAKPSLKKGDPVYLNKTLQGLKKLEDPDSRKWCLEKKFNELKTVANDKACKCKFVQHKPI